jgi:hypothetical protein
MLAALAGLTAVAVLAVPRTARGGRAGLQERPLALSDQP